MLLDPLDSVALQAPAAKPARKAAKKRGPSTTKRSTEFLEQRGYLVGRVEQWIPNTAITRDLFGFIDLLAIKRGEVLAVQCTSKSNIADRIRKITEHDNVLRVREAGIRIEVHGWDGDSVRVEDLS